MYPCGALFDRQFQLHAKRLSIVHNAKTPSCSPKFLISAGAPVAGALLSMCRIKVPAWL